VSNTSPTYREKLKCTVPQIDDIFVECLANALHHLDEEGVEAWLKSAEKICNMGQGMELVMIILEDGVELVQLTDITILEKTVETAQFLSDNACGRAINAFLSTLLAIAGRLGGIELVEQWFVLVKKVAAAQSERSEINVSRYEGLRALLIQSPSLFGQISIGGMANWIEAGLNNYKNQNHLLQNYFGLQSADAHAMLQRERHGTLYMDYERQINMFLRAFFGLEEEFHPYSLAFDIARKPTPHLDRRGFYVPDVHEDFETADGTTINGIDRYRAMIAHLAAHRKWSKPYLADNFSPFQHIAIECFEDARIEALAIQRYPGLRRLWQHLHPTPKEDACPDKDWSCVRHLLAMQSRALLDPDHPYKNDKIRQFAASFHEEFAKNPEDPELSVRLGVKWLTTFQTKDFRLANIWFEDTQVAYRDDNRYLWMFLEAAEDDSDFHSDHAASDRQNMEESGNLPPQHYQEWDYQSQTYRPDWTTVYETIQSRGDPSYIDALLDKHKQLIRRLKQIVDLLKPQQRKRIRYQSEGDELDMDVLLRAWTDFKAGTSPDTRYYQSHVKDGRDISILLLLDLSQSINEVPEGLSSTILELSQEAVAVLSEAVEALGDPFAIAGFASNTRHEVRYTHFKGFTESWNDDAKGRIANMEGKFSTRMGAALRHGARYLEHRDEEKKILFLLTDGAPRDIDVTDEQYLQDDTRKAVVELEQKGINTFCITLDPLADEYVARIFGDNRYSIIDNVERLPERLPALFAALTG